MPEDLAKNRQSISDAGKSVPQAGQEVIDAGTQFRNVQRRQPAGMMRVSEAEQAERSGNFSQINTVSQPKRNPKILRGEEYKNRFNIVEVIAWLSLAVLFDILDYFFDLPIADFTYTPASQVYFLLKGLPRKTQFMGLAGNAIEMIPAIDLLPIRTIDMALIFWAHWNPKSFFGKILKVEVLSTIGGPVFGLSSVVKTPSGFARSKKLQSQQTSHTDS